MDIYRNNTHCTYRQQESMSKVNNFSITCILLEGVQRFKVVLEGAEFCGSFNPRILITTSFKLSVHDFAAKSFCFAVW